MIPILISIVILLLGVAGFIIWNLLTKVERQEDVIQSYQAYLTSVDTSIKIASKKLEDIDTRGMFSSDDEIGWYFTQIKDIQKILDEYKLKI
jgi:uncharacterized membrane protein YukC